MRYHINWGTEEFIEFSAPAPKDDDRLGNILIEAGNVLKNKKHSIVFHEDNEFPPIKT